MSKDTKQYCLIGLPKSGKTSFVAALWHTVTTKELSESLKVVALPGDRVYLEQIRDEWLKCGDLNRTTMDVMNHISLQVVDSSTSNQADFTFPDVKGELFKQLYETRHLPLGFKEILFNANGILLFVGNKVVSPHMISDYEDVLGGEANIPARPWTPADSPTQVILVDLLQAACEIMKPRFKVAIVISAWDMHLKAAQILQESTTPTGWIKKNLPFLHQFVFTNQHQFTYECFGISAQGGDYDHDKNELFNFDKQSERVKVQKNGVVDIAHDITIPIKWLLNSE